MSSGDNDAQGAVVEAQNVYEMIPTKEEEIMPSVPTKGAKDSIPEDCIYESMPCDHIQMHSREESLDSTLTCENNLYSLATGEETHPAEEELGGCDTAVALEDKGKKK